MPDPTYCRPIFPAFQHHNEKSSKFQLKANSSVDSEEPQLTPMPHSYLFPRPSTHSLPKQSKTPLNNMLSQKALHYDKNVRYCYLHETYRQISSFHDLNAESM